MPLLLVAGWQIDFQAVNPSQTGLLGPAVLLLTIGFIIYLSAVPFHLWMAPTSTDSEPLAQILAFSFMPFLALSVYANALLQFEWYANSVTPYQWFVFSGSVSVVIGALLAFHVTEFGRFTSSVVLIDIGAVLLAMGLGSQKGLDAAWNILIFRLVGLIVWSTGLSAIRKQTKSDKIEQATGFGRKSILATALLLLGGLSLAGFPLTPGFPGRWIILSLIAQKNMRLAIPLLLGTVSGVIGVLRIARIMFKSAPESTGVQETDRWKWVDRIILILVLAVAIVMALFPAPLLSLALQLTNSGNIIP
jgi:multicomponent Na+:H+ antiporter subunit D